MDGESFKCSDLTEVGSDVPTDVRDTHTFTITRFCCSVPVLVPLWYSKIVKLVWATEGTTQLSQSLFVSINIHS